jgi:hypothetical protein
MAQAGILATGSWDKTLKVQVTPFSHPTQFLSFCFLLFPSTWSLTLGNTPRIKVLGPPIAHSIGHCGTQGQMLRDGREESGARSRNRGPTYPDF